MRKMTFGVGMLFVITLAQAQTPAINSGGIVNTGSYASGGVAPGSIVSIFGTNLADSPASASSMPLPTTLANVQSVTFNNVAAGLYFVSPNQINAEVPWNVLASGGSSTVNVVVTTSSGASTPQTVQIMTAMPGIFTVSANGAGQAIATSDIDGDIAAPAASISSAASHPVQTSAYLLLWATGLGAVEATMVNGGNTGGQIVNTLIKPTVLIGGVAATLVYSVLSPQYAGEYQIAVQLGPGTPTGTAVPIQIQMAGVTSPNNVTIAVAAPALTPLTTACTLTSTDCTAITLNGDPPSSTIFAGYADPSIREDPLTGTLWMAYSWPHTVTDSGGTYQAIDIHLSFSTDGGKTWNYQGPLYTAQPVTNPVTGQTDYQAHEVINLLPQVVNGVTYWYAIHSTYLVPANGGGGGSSLQNYSKRWEFAYAAGSATTGPMGLAAATPQFLGQNIDSYPQDFPTSLVLNSLNSDLTGCEQFYEPAMVLSSDNNTLYLFLSCAPSDANPTNIFYAVFKTVDPQDNVGNWTWTYVPQAAARFASLGDALSVGSYLGSGTTYLTQMDIVPSKQAGVLLAIVTAAYNDANGKVSLGCAAAELASLEPPQFVYNAQGQVQVDAVVASPDSEGDGPGSCTYSPQSATGIIIAHRQTSKAPQNGGFFVFLMQSLLMP